MKSELIKGDLVLIKNKEYFQKHSKLPLILSEEEMGFDKYGKVLDIYDWGVFYTYLIEIYGTPERRVVNLDRDCLICKTKISFNKNVQV